MSNRLKLDELIRAVADECGLPKAAVRRVLHQLSDVVLERLAAGEPVRLQNLGTLTVRQVAPRRFRHPVTHEMARTTAHRAVVFRAAGVMTQRVKRAGQGKPTAPPLGARAASTGGAPSAVPVRGRHRGVLWGAALAIAAMGWALVALHGWQVSAPPPVAAPPITGAYAVASLSPRPPEPPAPLPARPAPSARSAQPAASAASPAMRPAPPAAAMVRMPGARQRAGRSGAAGKSLPHVSAPTVATPGAAPARMLEHVVRSGETLSSLAVRYYGDYRDWPVLYLSNARVLADPNALNVGQQLEVIPLDGRLTPAQRWSWVARGNAAVAKLYDERHDLRAKIYWRAVARAQRRAHHLAAEAWPSASHAHHVPLLSRRSGVPRAATFRP